MKRFINFYTLLILNLLLVNNFNISMSFSITDLFYQTKKKENSNEFKKDEENTISKSEKSKNVNSINEIKKSTSNLNNLSKKSEKLKKEINENFKDNTEVNQQNYYASSIFDLIPNFFGFDRFNNTDKSINTNIISSFSSSIFSSNDMNGKEESHTRSYNYSNVNGKENEDINGLDLEKKNSLDKNGEHTIRKAARLFNKHNNEKMHLKQKISSTNDMENLALKTSNSRDNLLEEKDLSNKEENQFINNDSFNRLFNYKNKILNNRKPISRNSNKINNLFNEEALFNMFSNNIMNFNNNKLIKQKKFLRSKTNNELENEISLKNEYKKNSDLFDSIFEDRNKNLAKIYR